MKIHEQNKKTYEFIGEVNGKFQDKVYQTKENIYRVQVKLENNTSVRELRAYETKTDSSVWKDLIDSNYIDKRYLFICEKIVSVYRLKNWKELPRKTNN
jgi:hypothetical protein